MFREADHPRGRDGRFAAGPVPAMPLRPSARRAPQIHTLVAPALWSSGPDGWLSAHPPPDWAVGDLATLSAVSPATGERTAHAGVCVAAARPGAPARFRPYRVAFRRDGRSETAARGKWEIRAHPDEDTVGWQEGETYTLPVALRSGQIRTVEALCLGAGRDGQDGPTVQFVPSDQPTRRSTVAMPEDGRGRFFRRGDRWLVRIVDQGWERGDVASLTVGLANGGETVFLGECVGHLHPPAPAPRLAVFDRRDGC